MDALTRLARTATAPRSVSIEHLFAGACVATVVILGLLRIPEPLTGDTALYLAGARAMSEGAVLYHDYWDMKQPGLFYLKYIAGKLFGFSAVGVRTFDVLYWTLASLALTVLLRPAFQHEYLAAAVPALLLAPYFGVLPNIYLTQVEALANAPILIAAACLVRAIDAGRRAPVWGFAGGILAGAVLSMKLALAPIFAGFFLVLLCHPAVHLPNRTWLERVRALFPIAIAFAAGTATVIGIVLLVCWWQGNLEAMLWTTFVYPTQVVQHGRLPSVSQLMVSAAQMLSYVAVYIPFVFLILLRPRAKKASIWIAMSIACLALGLFVILLQRYSWWSYHFALLLGPVAMAAVLGIDRCLSWLETRCGFDRLAKIAVLAILLLPLLATLLYPSLRRAVDIASIMGGRSLDSVLRERHIEYARLAETADVVKPLAKGTPIYVMGNPVIYELLSARQAIAYHGWSLEFTTPDEWRKLAASLERARPQLVFIDNVFRDTVRNRSPAISAWLETAYRKMGEARYGQWYGRIDLK